MAFPLEINLTQLHNITILELLYYYSYLFQTKGKHTMKRFHKHTPKTYNPAEKTPVIKSSHLLSCADAAFDDRCFLGWVVGFWCVFVESFHGVFSFRLEQIRIVIK